MRNFLEYTSTQRRTKTTDGVATVTRVASDTAGVTKVDIGIVTQPMGSKKFIAQLLNGSPLKTLFDTRKAAGGQLKALFDNDGVPAVKTVSLEAAAKVLCPNAKNRMSALKKKISRGSVETVDVDGETRVVL